MQRKIAIALRIVDELLRPTISLAQCFINFLGEIMKNYLKGFSLFIGLIFSVFVLTISYSNAFTTTNDNTVGVTDTSNQSNQSDEGKLIHKNQKPNENATQNGDNKPTPKAPDGDTTDTSY